VRHRFPTLLCLFLALIGYWSPWFTHRVASLRLNGYELSEWVMALPQVRDGSLHLDRLAFFIPLACVAWLLANAASRYRGAPPAHLRAWWSGLPPRTWLSWGLMILAGLCLFMVFPPYDAYVRADYWPEYRSQFIVACAILIGMALAFFLPNEIKYAAQMATALVGGGYGLWAYLAVRPLAMGLLGASWGVLGAGWALMLVGFAGLAWLGLTQLFGPKD
jgi:hypothetical protein